MKFIRKNGRIIPIRDKNERARKETVKGIAEIGAGAAAGTAAGVGTASLVKKAQGVAHESKNMYRIAQSNFRAALGFPVRGTVRSITRGSADVAAAIAKRGIAKKMFRARNPILHAGAAGAALLIGQGVGRITAAHKVKDHGATGKAVGVAAGIATYGAYYRGLGFTKPLEIGVNIYSRMKGMARPFKKYGPGKGV